MSLVNVGSLYVILLAGIILSLIVIVLENICQGDDGNDDINDDLDRSRSLHSGS